MHKVLILGGGFGGLTAAQALKAKLGDDVEITLVDRRSYFMVGFRKTWALTGQSTLEEGQRPLVALEKIGVQVIKGNITAIDPKAHSAVVDGQNFEADALIVALGAQLAPEAIPGFEEYAINVYDPAIISQAALTLQNFPGGRVVVGIFGEAYKCPPAPYEIALAVNELFRNRSIQAQIEVFTPKPMTLPILGEAGCAIIESRLEDEGISFLPNHSADIVEEGQVIFKTGSRSFDLLLGIPPHRCPQVIVDSGLADGQPWVPVDPRSLQSRFSDVYAIGDNSKIMMANGKRLPMAGVFAEAQGKVAAEHIAAAFQGRQATEFFEGKGGCFLEIGKGEAMMVEGEFLAQPVPLVTLTDPSPEYFAQKHAVERDLLSALES